MLLPFASTGDLLAADVLASEVDSPESVVASPLEPDAAGDFAAFFLGFFFFVIGAEHSEFAKSRHEKERAKARKNDERSQKATESGTG